MAKWAFSWNTLGWFVAASSVFAVAWCVRLRFRMTDIGPKHSFRGLELVDETAVATQVSITVADNHTPVDEKMNTLLLNARNASRDPRDCCKTIDALKALGFGEDSFARLHHMNGRMSTFYSFSEGVQQYMLDGNNHRVHQRLMYILLSCSGNALPKGKSFQTLAEEAFRLIPPI